MRGTTIRSAPAGLEESDEPSIRARPGIRVDTTAAAAPSHLLRLRSETFVPASGGRSRDPRVLGVMWESAAVVQ